MREVCFIADGHTATTCVISIFSTSSRTEDCFVPAERERVGDTEKATSNQQIKGKQSGLFSHGTGPE